MSLGVYSKRVNPSMSQAAVRITDANEPVMVIPKRLESCCEHLKAHDEDPQGRPT